VPRKIRQLVADLERAGWRLIEGSHRKFAHPRSRNRVILSGQPGADALHYQEKHVKQAIREVQK
jgi:predicted RNA binding protein YcfA (HicA-like mRNA interferase family)